MSSMIHTSAEDCTFNSECCILVLEAQDSHEAGSHGEGKLVKDNMFKPGTLSLCTLKF